MRVRSVLQRCLRRGRRRLLRFGYARQTKRQSRTENATDAARSHASALPLYFDSAGFP